ncbi:hypothetical protein CR513_03793, partial [Mucuna pruriens]
MPLDLRQSLLDLLKEYVDVFTWSYRDMPGLDHEIVEHKLPLHPNSVPLRRMKPEVALKIKEKVEKQRNTGFLAIVEYSKDLNRANPKDNFPLPYTDMLVDNTTQYAFFSFMDNFSRYNQICMAPEDREKTTFITTWGTFCYKVMPFGLKNAEMTYQRTMVTLFHDMMHKEIEVYVDDMIAKSRTLELNLAKCTFGVKLGKPLGFVVNERGIEVNLDKVKAIREMSAPRTESKVHGFLGRINYIARFISQLTATCSPIFKLLCKNQKMDWDPDY